MGTLRKFVIGTLTAAALHFPAVAQEPVRYGYGTHAPAPQVILEGGQLVGGFYKQIGEELARRLSRPVIFVPASRKRLEEKLLSGEMHIYCGMTPQWFDQPDLYLWTEPVYADNTVVAVRRADQLRFRRLEDMEGRVIGAIHGFRYAEKLETLFLQGRLIREDAPNNESNISKLMHGRIDGLVGTGLTLHHLLLTQRLITQVRFVEELVNQAWMHCMISRHPDVPGQELADTIHGMLGDGYFEAILMPGS